MSLRRSARISEAPAIKSTDNGSSNANLKRPLVSDGQFMSPPSKRSRTRHTGQATEANDAAFKATIPSSIPGCQRTSAKRESTPPLKPIPSFAGSTTIPNYSTGDIDDATPSPLSRPANPHASNATLVTPGGTQNTAYSYQPLVSPSSKSKPNDLPTSLPTTSTLLSQACAHLVRAEPRIAPLIHKHHCHTFSPSGLAEKIDPFCSLASGIMAQQVSGAAAKSIKRKFIALFSEADLSPFRFPTPAQVTATEISRLRLAGLSQRKAEYIHGLAEKFSTGQLSTEILLHANDEEVMEKLVAVRGLGKWSVEMFACFGLKRMDVFSTGDLGVQRGMAAFMGKDVRKLKAIGGGKWKYMSEKDMLEGSEKFRPYRSLFMWYMWWAEDVDVSAVEGNVGDVDGAATEVT